MSIQFLLEQVIWDQIVLQIQTMLSEQLLDIFQVLVLMVKCFTCIFIQQY